MLHSEFHAILFEHFSVNCVMKLVRLNTDNINIITQKFSNRTENKSSVLVDFAQLRPNFPLATYCA